VATTRAGAEARLLALIPAHDEAPGIGRVVAAARVHLPVLVVDDGSTDDTAAIAERAGARVVRQAPNRGKGAALRTGFRAAIDDGAQAVVTLDGDGQHDPTEIPAFVAAFERREQARREQARREQGRHEQAGRAGGRDMTELAELVVGRRDFRHMPAVRRLSNWLGTVALSAAVGRWIDDNQSGYRLVGRRLMAAMLDSRESGFAFEVEMIAICLREGWPIEWLPIRTIYGDERSHIRPLRHLREFLAVTRRARGIARDQPRRHREPQAPTGEASAPTVSGTPRTRRRRLAASRRSQPPRP
jgi:glycosyltransferase involved in cell wall biosynthesis